MKERSKKESIERDLPFGILAITVTSILIFAVCDVLIPRKALLELVFVSDAYGESDEHDEAPAQVGRGAIDDTADELRSEDPEVELPHARASLLVGRPAPLSGGRTTIAVHFEIDPEWHLYWRGRNDTGFAPQITWELPDGATVTERFWPVPERHVSVGGILDHVYESEITLLFELDLEPRPGLGETEPRPTVPIGAKIDWLVCRDVCLFESDSLSLDFGLGEWAEDDSDRILRAGRELPLAYGSEFGEEISVQWLKDRVRLEAGRADSVQFYPFEDCLPTPDLLESGSARGRRLELPLEVRNTETSALGSASRVADSLSGVLVVFRSREEAAGEGRRIAYRIEEPRPVP